MHDSGIPSARDLQNLPRFGSGPLRGWTAVMDAVPIPVFFFLTLVLGFTSVELGRWIGKRRPPDGGEPEAPVGAAVAATLGLLAFTLGLTFSMAASRFDARKQLVVADANAIGTTYLRTSLLPEPQASRFRQILRDYTDMRVDAALHAEDFQKALAGSEALQSQLWRETADYAAKNPNAVTALFVDAVNHMIDVHGLRLAAVRSRTPGAIWAFLFLTAAVGLLSIGYHAGLSGARRSVAATALVLAFSGIIMLIGDLDRPDRGFLVISQQPMIDLQASMHGASPAPAAPSETR
jgi:hypothetical protein